MSQLNSKPANNQINKNKLKKKKAKHLPCECSIFAKLKHFFYIQRETF